MKFPESLEASGLAEWGSDGLGPGPGPEMHWKPQKIVRLSGGQWEWQSVSILMWLEIQREREREEKFSTKKNHQINMIVYWYNDGLEISKLNKYLHIYIYLFIHLYRIAEVALSDFLNQEEIPGNHQKCAENLQHINCRDYLDMTCAVLDIYIILYNKFKRDLHNLTRLYCSIPYYIIKRIKMSEIPIRLIEFSSGWV